MSFKLSREETKARDERIRARRKEGATVKQIAAEFGLSVPRVYAILRKPGAPTKRRGHKRRSDDGWAPEERLAVAILLRAIDDWKKRPRLAEQEAQEMGFGSLEEELLDFFRGPWCRELLRLLGCGFDDLLALLRQADEDAP